MNFRVTKGEFNIRVPQVVSTVSYVFPNRNPCPEAAKAVKGTISSKAEGLGGSGVWGLGGLGFRI